MATSSFGNIGQLMTQPQAPARAAPAPQEQLGLWQKFQQKLQTDPNFKMALMTAGLNMLKSPGPGQSGFDTFAEGALSGVGTLDQLRQRDRTEGRQDQKLDLAERGVATSEERTGIARTTAGDTKKARADSLAETRRQFNERLKAGDFSPAGSQSTGDERATQALVRALRAKRPEEFPDDNSALLYVADLEGKRKSKDSIAVQIMRDAGKILANNIFLPEDQQITREEAVDMVMEDFQSARDMLTGTEDKIDGQTINHPTQGTGKIVKVGEDRYVVEFPGGNTATLTGDAIKNLIGTAPSAN
jgi:hypothetical protein